MALAINTNVMALNTRHKLSSSNLDMAKTLEKLSSGLRINRAADDAAGLAVSEKLRAQIRGSSQAMRNAQDGISMIQTAEGALVEVHDMLQRMRELSVQAANDTYSADDRKAINNEIQALKSEINAISQRTKFNGKALLTGAMSTNLSNSTEVKGGVSFQAGAAGVGNTGSVVAFTAVDVSAAKAGTTFTVDVNGSNLRITAGSVSQEIALNTDMTTPGGVGESASQAFDFNQLGIKLTLSVTQNGATGGATATEIGTAVGGFNDIVTDAASNSANFQIGAGSGGVAQGDAIQVAFNRMDISAAGLSGLHTALNNFDNAITGNTFMPANAEALISALDGAITSVNDLRGGLGGVQNRLEHTIKSLSVSVENLSASESRIRDTDVAMETSNMVRAQILTQAGTSILAQANQVPQSALSLLKG